MASQVPTTSTGISAGPSGEKRSSLYVGDLDKSVDEGLLYQIFSKLGPVASIRICRDSATRRSLGYGYVNYLITNEEKGAAQKAIELLAYTNVKDKPMRVMWANRDAKKRNNGIGNIFVKGLNSEIDSRTLHDTFEVFGVITSAKVARNDEGESLGYGYVQYETKESADKAVERANGMHLEGKQLYVAHYATKEARNSKQGYTNLYVKNLPNSIMSEEEFNAMFSVYGEITSHCLPKDENEQIRGFGFVNFKEVEVANKVVEEMHGREIEGKKLYVAPAQKKAERKKQLEDKFDKHRKELQESTHGRNLYVKHLDPEIDDEKLEQLFQKFGTITSCKVMTDESNKSRCFGFVCFSNLEEAAHALDDMNNRLIGSQHLYVTIAQPKAVRQAQIERERLSRMSVTNGVNNMSLSPTYNTMAPPPPPPPPPPTAPAYHQVPIWTTGPPPPPPHPHPHSHPPPPHPHAHAHPPPLPHQQQQQSSVRHHVVATGPHPHAPPPSQQQQQQISTQSSPQAPGTSVTNSGGHVIRKGYGNRGNMNMNGGRGYRRNNYGQRNGNVRDGWREMSSSSSPPPPPHPPPSHSHSYYHSSSASQLPLPPSSPSRDISQGHGMLAESAIRSNYEQQREPESNKQSFAERSMNRTSALASAAPEQQKIMLGEQLYPLITDMYPDKAAKITGMLLEMDNSEVIYLLDNTEALKEKIEEALKVLRSHET